MISRPISVLSVTSITSADATDDGAWVPKTTHVLENKTLIKLQRDDAGFNKWLWGTAKFDTRTTMLLNEVIRLQNAAVRASIIPDVLAKEEDKTSYQLRREKVALQKLIESVGNKLIKGFLPAFVLEGEAVERVETHIPLSLESTCATIHADPAVLRWLYMRARTFQVAPKRKAERVSPGKGVYWHSQKKAFVAQRPSDAVKDGGTQYKVFKEFKTDTALRWTGVSDAETGDEHHVAIELGDEEHVAIEYGET
jgi:hypothetical protein